MKSCLKKNLKLISNFLLLGNIQLPKNSGDFFFLSAFGNNEDGYKFQGSNSVIDSSVSFPSLDLKTGSGSFDYCLRAKLVTINNSSKLALIPSHCSIVSGVICTQKPFQCDASATNYTHWALKLQMDPDLSTKRDQLTQPKQDQMRNLFRRLNKTHAYETLFRMMWYSNPPCSGVIVIKQFCLNGAKKLECLTEVIFVALF
jgi:hypothetical protein